jgi:all-trans-retinol 13,14-reductase
LRLVVTELSTPICRGVHRRGQGGVCELTSPRRFLSTALRPRTPVRGLYLTGQDVGSPGITGAMMAGMMCAAALDPRVLRHL